MKAGELPPTRKISLTSPPPKLQQSANLKFTYKDRPFELDQQNNQKIMQRRHVFRTFIKDYMSKVSRIDQDVPEMRKIQKQQEEKNIEMNEMVRKLLEKQKKVDDKLERHWEKMGESSPGLKRTMTLSQKRGSLKYKENHWQEKRDRLEVEINKIRNEQEKIQLKKELDAKKPSKLQNLKDDIDEVVFSNIQTLVDPTSNGAKMAMQRIQNEKYKKSMNQQNAAGLPKSSPKANKQQLPQIQNKGNLSQRIQAESNMNVNESNTEEKVKPLKSIVVSGTRKDVQSVYFKKKHAMSAFKFKTELYGTIDALDSSQEQKSTQFRQKINESIENLAKLRNGADLNDIQFYKPLETGMRISPRGVINSARVEKSTIENGLPIFENKHYIQDLSKLLSSKDLEECYDYDANDSSYKKLYECLTFRKNMQIVKQNVIDKNQPTLGDQSVTQLDNVGQITETPSVCHPNLTIRNSNVNLSKINSTDKLVPTDKKETFNFKNLQDLKADNDITFLTQSPDLQLSVSRNSPRNFETDVSQNQEMTVKMPGSKVAKRNFHDNKTTQNTTIFGNTSKKFGISAFSIHESSRDLETPGPFNIQNMMLDRINSKQNMFTSMQGGDSQNSPSTSNTFIGGVSRYLNHTSSKGIAGFGITPKQNSKHELSQFKLKTNPSRNLTINPDQSRDTLDIHDISEIKAHNQSQKPQKDGSQSGGVGLTLKAKMKNKIVVNNRRTSVNEAGQQTGDNKTPLEEPSYKDLNTKLQFPNNPAYFTMKKVDISSSEQDQQKMKNEMNNAINAKNQTILDFCRQQGIAFTDNDKTMYNLQNSRKMHKIFENFMNKDTKIVDLNRVEMPIDPRSNISPLSMSPQKTSSKSLTTSGHRKREEGPIISLMELSKFNLNKIAFDKYGKLNKYLDEEDILKSFKDIVNLPHDDEEKSKELERKYFKLFQKIREEENQNMKEVDIEEVVRDKDNFEGTFEMVDTESDDENESNGQLNSNNSKSSLTNNKPQLGAKLQSTQRKDQKGSTLSILTNKSKNKKKQVEIKQNSQETINEEEDSDQQSIDKTSSLSQTQNLTIKPPNYQKTFKKQQMSPTQLKATASKDLEQNKVYQQIQRLKNSSFGAHAMTQRFKKNNINLKNNDYSLTSSQTPNAASSKTINIRNEENESPDPMNLSLKQGLSTLTDNNPFSSKNKRDKELSPQRWLQLYSQNPASAGLSKDKNFRRKGFRKLTEQEVYNQLVISQYQQMNQKLKDSIKKMRDLDDVPATRDGYIKLIEDLNYKEKKRLKRAQSVKKPKNETGNESEKSSEISDTESEKKRFQKAVRKVDQTYDMLDACTSRYKVKHRIDEKTQKLMERMDLDRPILQKEKYDLIFLEKTEDLMGGQVKRNLTDKNPNDKYDPNGLTLRHNQSRQTYDSIYHQNKPNDKFMDKLNCFARTMDDLNSFAHGTKDTDQKFIEGMSSIINKGMTPRLQDAGSNGSSDDLASVGDMQQRVKNKPKKHKKKLDVEQIRHALTDKARQRKVDNNFQIRAFKKMQEYIKNRYLIDRIMPSRDDIKFLEVLKKIIESGWIIGDDEMRQVMEFLGFKSSMFIGKENIVFREFLHFSLKELNLRGALIDYVAE